MWGLTFFWAFLGSVLGGYLGLLTLGLILTSSNEEEPEEDAEEVDPADWWKGEGHE